MIERLGITFAMGSDHAQDVQRAFRVQNPDTQELALHAVYILDEQGEIFYRKVARRRPLSNELIDAIDYHRGVYPQHDRVNPRQPITVAYPENNFQAILEAARVSTLPASIDAAQYRQVYDLARKIHSDDALIAWRNLMDASNGAGLQDLLDAASLLARQTYFDEDHPALAAGQQLRKRLDAVSLLEAEFDQTSDTDQKDALLDRLGRARALLERTRAIITQHADEWRLRLLKTSIRSYREVGRASFRARSG